MEIRTVLPDGSENSETEFDLPIVDRDGNPYDPPVVIRCRPVDIRARQEIEKASEEFVKTRGRGMERKTNAHKAAQMVLERAVVSWTGISGAGGGDLVCTNETKAHLPEHVKVQVIDAALSTEATDASSSFRESA